MALAGVLALSAAPAMADGTGGDEGSLLTDNVMLTPEEVAELGFSADRVAIQADAMAALSQEELEQQDALRAEQDAIAADVPASEPLEIIGTSGAPHDGGMITPQVTEWPCWLNNNGYYRVTDDNDKSRCWASGGKVTWNSASIWYDVRHLRPGNYEGRILWDNNGASVLYWSVWRGPSSTTYTFDKSLYQPRMWGLELK